MKTVKRINGDYNITSVGASDNVNVTAHTVNVTGNLEVTGNLTYIDTETLQIQDPVIVLNKGDTYAANAGIVTHKTSNTFAGLRWSNSAGAWQTSTSTDEAGETGTWVNISTSADEYSTYPHQASTPGNVASTTIVYGNAVGSGGSGVYFVDEDNNVDELVSKSKAIVYGIIF